MNDRGAAAERTALAWQRSSLSLAAIGALMARIAEQHSPWLPSALLAAVAFAAALAAAGYGRRRYRAGATAARPEVNRALAVAVGALGVASAVSVVLALA